MIQVYTKLAALKHKQADVISYVSFMDAKGKLQNERSMQTWHDWRKPNAEFNLCDFDNTAFTPEVVSEAPSRATYSRYSSDKIRLLHPVHRFVFEIYLKDFFEILDNEGIDAKCVFRSKYYIAGTSSNLILIREDAKDLKFIEVEVSVQDKVERIHSKEFAQYDKSYDENNVFICKRKYYGKAFKLPNIKTYGYLVCSANMYHVAMSSGTYAWKMATPFVFYCPTINKFYLSTKDDFFDVEDVTPIDIDYSRTFVKGNIHSSLGIGANIYDSKSYENMTFVKDIATEKVASYKDIVATYKLNHSEIPEKELDEFDKFDGKEKEIRRNITYTNKQNFNFTLWSPALLAATDKIKSGRHFLVGELNYYDGLRYNYDGLIKFKWEHSNKEKLENVSTGWIGQIELDEVTYSSIKDYYPGYKNVKKKEDLIPVGTTFIDDIHYYVDGFKNKWIGQVCSKVENKKIPTLVVQAMNTSDIDAYAYGPIGYMPYELVYKICKFYAQKQGWITEKCSVRTLSKYECERS